MKINHFKMMMNDQVSSFESSLYTFKTCDILCIVLLTRQKERKKERKQK